MPHDVSESTARRSGRARLAGWARRTWRALAAEVVATALLVALGVAALLPAGAPLSHPALAFGFVVLANVEAFGPVSGAHMNPSVTLAAVLFGQLPAATGAAYALAQLAGATLGFGALLALHERAAVAGATLPRAGGSAAAAAAVEALLTGVLALVCCAVWSAHRAGDRDPAVSIKFGLTVAGLVYAGGEMSGASLNPARSFAPALLQGRWADHWVYWVGPLGGAALATLLHRFVLRPAPAPAPASRTPPETLPLAEKRDPA